MNQFTQAWTEEMDGRIRVMFHDGKSARDIGEAMGKSRNAVIGRLHRIGLVRSPTQIAEAKAASNKLRRKNDPKKSRPIFRIKRRAGLIQPPRIIVEPPRLGLSRDLKLLDLTAHDCKWPYGEWPFVFCGNPKPVEVSYCPYHASLAYTRAKANA